MENNIAELIESTLHISRNEPSKKFTIPCYMLDYGYLKSGKVFGNGKCKISEAYVQIDLYYEKKTDRDEAAKTLVSTISQSYVYPTMENIFDPTTKLYRSTIKFTVEESEE